jgi:hypothetical protein
MSKRMMLVGAALALWALVAGSCDEGLKQSFEDVRSAAPDVCKEYCEEKLGCEWEPAVGDQDLEDEAFSAAIRRCTVECSWYTAFGAYVTEQDFVENDRMYVGQVTGSQLEEAHDCVYRLGVYRCAEDLEGPDTHLFDPGVEAQCAAADDCLDVLDIEMAFEWTPGAGDAPGTCSPTGLQRLEIPFF